MPGRRVDIGDFELTRCMLRNKTTVPAAEWASNHFSWPLVADDELSVELEEIPEAGGSERHFHQKSRHFFFVLEGECAVDFGDHRYFLKKHDGIEIPLGKEHQVSNSGAERLLLMHISSPKVQENDVFYAAERQ